MPGESYVEAIVEAIDDSRLIVFVFSSNSNESSHVSRELGRAVNAGVPILPFRIEDISPSPALEFYISGAHWLDAMTPPMKEHLDHLAFTARTLLGMQSGEGAAPPPPDMAEVSGSGGGRLPGGPWPWAVAGAVAVLLVLGVVLGVVLGGGDGEQADTTDETTIEETADETASEGTSSGDAGADVGSEGESVEPGDVGDPFTLAVGTCYLGNLAPVDVVDCNEPHDEEVAARLEHPAGPDEAYPGSAELAGFVDEACTTAFEDYTGQSYAYSPVVYGLGPLSEADWDLGDRTVVCWIIAAEAGEQLTGSARGSG
jgi:hypothetical protein